jgi:hypothetical protein
VSWAFTRGPWAVLPEEAEKLYIRVRGTRLGERFKIANAPFPIANEIEKQEALANARLIAAAPELYEALESLLKGCGIIAESKGINIEAECLAFVDSPFAKARRALAKARGEA